MKIGIFIPRLEEFFLYKDVGQIAYGLRDIGNEVSIVTYESKVKNPPMNIIVADESKLINGTFFHESSFDAFIVYSWMSVKLNRVVAAAKREGVTVIIKMDGDGRIAFPVKQSQLRGAFSFPMSIADFARYIKVFTKWILFGTIFFEKKIAQLKDADAVIIETPRGRDNLSFFLSSHGASSLIKKINVVPDPVEDIFELPRRVVKKNCVVACGRWYDRQKNRELCLNALVYFLKERSDWEALIIGAGNDDFVFKAKKLSPSLRKRIRIVGQVDRGGMVQHLATAKMLFLPSRWESFGIVAAEALVCGCSVVGTPIDPLYYFTQDIYGDVSSDFSVAAVGKALLLDAHKWDISFFDSQKIIQHWLPIFDRKNIAREIEKIIIAQWRR